VLKVHEISDDRIRHEVRIVTDEISQAVDGSVMGGFPWLWLPSVLYDTSQLSHNGYGDIASLSLTTSSTVTSFFTAQYVAENAALVLAGRFTPEIVEMTAEAFSDSRRRSGTPPRRGPTRFGADGWAPRPPAWVRAAEQPHTASAAAWILDGKHEDLGFVAAAVLGDVLVGPDDGALEAVLSDPVDLAAYVGPFGDPWNVGPPMPFIVEIHHRQGADPLDDIALAQECMRDLAKFVDQDFMDAAARTLATAMTERLDQPETCSQLLAATQIIHDSPSIALDIPRRLLTTPSSAVLEVAETLSARPPRVLIRGPHEVQGARPL
jgi:hypothetical protein